MTSSRRTFLEAAGASLTLGPSVAEAARQGRRPRVAALASTYHYLSHAYHIVGRFLDGFVVHDGHGLHRPECEIASLYIEQTPEATDLGRAKAARFNVRLAPTIADALTLGTGVLAVDAVLLIAEHGDYPINAKLQKLYPRGIYFQQHPRRLPRVRPERRRSSSTSISRTTAARPRRWSRRRRRSASP